MLKEMCLDNLSVRLQSIEILVMILLQSPGLLFDQTFRDLNQEIKNVFQFETVFCAGKVFAWLRALRHRAHLKT